MHWQLLFKCTVEGMGRGYGLLDTERDVVAFFSRLEQGRTVAHLTWAATMLEFTLP